MDLNKMRKDITRLIDDIKYHSDSLSQFDQLPIIQLNIILAKMHQMTEKTIILRHNLELTYGKGQLSEQIPEQVAEPIRETETMPETGQHKPDLRSAIGIYERYLYANELFNGSIEAYDEAVNTLNEFDELEKANYYISEGLMKEFNWDEENEFVSAFCTLVKRRYEQTAS